MLPISDMVALTSELEMSISNVSCSGYDGAFVCPGLYALAVEQSGSAQTDGTVVNSRSDAPERS